MFNIKIFITLTVLLALLTILSCAIYLKILDSIATTQGPWFDQ